MTDKPTIRVTADEITAGLVKRGMPQHVAEGFTLNFGDESGFNPTAVGDNGNAFGLAQWNGKRMKALKAYAAANGKDVANPETQLDYLMTEVEGSERGAYNRILRATNRAEAAVAVLNHFERPAEVHRKRREAAYLGGLVPRGEYNGGANAVPPGNPSTAAAQEAQADRMSLLTDPTQTGGMDITEVGTVPGVRAVSDEERVAAEAAALANSPEDGGVLDMFVAAIDEQHIATNMLRQIGKESYAPDAEFQNKGFDEALWKEVTEGLPTEYHQAFEQAGSADHARAIARSTRESFERDQKLAAWGYTGVGAQVVASILDPVSIAASFLTEGMAAPVIYGTKLTKLGRALRAGAAAAAVNTAMDGYLISQDPTGDWSDLAYSASAGFLLGGAAGMWRPSLVDAEFTDAIRKVEKNGGTLTDPEPAVAPLTAPDGNLSAARVDGLRTDMTDAEKALIIVGDAPTAVLPNWRMDLVGRLKTSENPIARWVAERLDEDGVGNKRGTVTVTSANEIKNRNIKQQTSRFYRDHADAFKAWSKEQGYGQKRHFDPAIRAEFNTLVGKAVRRPNDAPPSPHVAKVASRLRAEYDEAVEIGRRNGIKGFAGIDKNYAYLNRQYNVQSLDDFLDQYNGGRAGAVRGGPVHRLFADALIEGTRAFKNKFPGKTASLEDLSPEDADDLAVALVNSIRGRKYQALDVERAFAGHNLDTLQEMLMDSGVALDRVTEILDKLKQPKDVNSGKLGLARHRLLLDETYRDPKTGLGIEDFLENDVEVLFGDYMNAFHGEVAYQQVFRDLRIPDDLGNITDTQAPSFAKVKQMIAAADKRPTEEVNAEMRGLDILYNQLKGIPQEPDTRWNTFLRRVRGWNFLRVMNQLGVAQLSELGMVLGNGGMRGLILHAPSFRDFTLAAKAGSLKDGILDECEAIWSSGLDVLTHTPHVRLDDGSAVSSRVRGGQSTKMQKFDHTMNSAKQAVATMSGMTHINRMLQRLNHRVLVQRFIDEAHGQKGLLLRKGITQKRYEALGISPEMAEKINAEILDKVTTRDGVLGKKVTHINIDQWTDIDAKNAFINGVDRWARRSVQENSAGTMPAFMSKEMGKMVFQFRTFMLGAYTKQVLGGIRQSDWETYSSFMASMFFGGVAYVAQTQINSVGRQDREAWIEERLSEGAIAKAAFQRAGFSTFMPMLIDMGAAPFTDEPIFAYRTTDLSTGIFGTPSADLLNNAGRAVKGTLKAVFQDDYEFSQQDARSITSILPFQNAFVIRNLLAYTVGNLPKFSQ